MFVHRDGGETIPCPAVGALSNIIVLYSGASGPYPPAVKDLMQEPDAQQAIENLCSKGPLRISSSR
jgi:hypothetical protein